jgi:hypothetical protein
MNYREYLWKEFNDKRYDYTRDNLRTLVRLVKDGWRGLEMNEPHPLESVVLLYTGWDDELDAEGVVECQRVIKACVDWLIKENVEF